MLIKLKQSEIEEALRDFIVKQGFNLDRKTVDISFTAGRGDSGMTADLDIHDAAAVSGGVSGGAPCSPVYETPADTSPVNEIVEQSTAQLRVVDASPAPEDVLPDPQEEEEPVVSTKQSLFGG